VNQAPGVSNRIIARFWSIAGAVSVRTKILGIILGLVLVLGLGITVVVRQALREVVLVELAARAESVTQDLASRSVDLILVNNVYALHQLARETQANHPDIRYVFILANDGSVLAHTFGSGFPGRITKANSAPPGEHHHIRVLDTTEGRIWDVAVPIFDGRAGTARIGFTEAVLHRTVDVVTTELLLATLIVSSVGILAAIALTWFLTRPILDLAQAARAVGHGDFSRRVPRWANDEIGDLSEAFNVMVSDLERAAEARQERDKLRAELVERVMTAQEDERKRIARDLHDQTSQSLVSLIVQLKLVESAPDDAARTQSLADLRDQLRAVLGDVRQMALDLRPNVLDDLGLLQAINWFADRCQHGGLQVTVSGWGPNCDGLDARQSLALYRVAQEALSNVVKHSGASRAGVKLMHQNHSLVLEVSDDGRGFVPGRRQRPGGGMGLFGMAERVQLLGGALNIDSRPGAGTRIRAVIPLAQQDAECD
jgi:signal transduction histidine kinase